MDKYTVAIIGGGVAGLSCALTLASAKDKGDWAYGRRYIVIDSGASDLLKAKLFNVPGVALGESGKDVLEQIRGQINHYGCVDFVGGEVKGVAGTRGDFSIRLRDDGDIKAEIVVIATGYKSFEIDINGLKVVPHKHTSKPDRVMIETDEYSMAADGIYIAGTLSGVSSMFATAAGSGVQSACSILSTFSGKPTIVHDKV
ncbi:FAD-dependent oxidoreductase [Candidatus Magnetomonas plexicatena]|uniref:FAD-dependent oxidoreductase n=1 Tax=Candidatus Magnetomonas plexicatena TaxID=2552947 RepID=UPI001C76F6BA|nr:NAD(P)/FAD-dependent oxidoreductase [Nitrospirales bacterium LBB_01]QWR77375.1 NAD(P)/FAD-dependent oxidoreductase [Nitrospirales bacterium LBB_01]